MNERESNKKRKMTFRVRRGETEVDIVLIGK